MINSIIIYIIIIIIIIIVYSGLTDATSELWSSQSSRAADMVSCNLRASSFASRIANGSFFSRMLLRRCHALKQQIPTIDNRDNIKIKRTKMAHHARANTSALCNENGKKCKHSCSKAERIAR